MTDFESTINDAITAYDIPGCVLVASNRDSSFSYAKVFGNASLKEGSERPIQLNTVMWTASCTKLMTSLCCMQLVERGLVSLDEPVYKQIPELETLNVISGFDDSGAPIETRQTKPITLRLLLTHSSGLTYDVMHPSTIAWLQYHKQPLRTSGKLLERFNVPLVFQPGESWIYGSSIDYAGLFVERVTGQTLEAYMKTNIWERLGIKDMTFHLSSRPDMKERMADMSLRDPSTKKARHTDTPMPYVDGEGKECSDCFGGQGVFTSAEEYLKVVKAVLMNDENEKLIKRETLEKFFAPQLGEGSKKTLNMLLQDDMTSRAMGNTPNSITKDWGLGGILLDSDIPSGMKAGTMIWGGAPNLKWWCDRKTGICGLYAGQVWPPGDAKVAELNEKFEEGIYALFAKHEKNARL
ncbi:beta-lactamase/transpeptidase-like protein [Plenodomus tracheiphilus IPT5]|uniref:Beta-lactamase/transpeptidase-like protein n=1 Tax=Plenodomus tracheiphilus IPT5 TaxID=1408161 RepID=A0A6A7BIZ2_9PLEO|nr:beta-lactamase/transpeptidase-like protein [Plenodomus tracheiphilus IPT5]